VFGEGVWSALPAGAVAAVGLVAGDVGVIGALSLVVAVALAVAPASVGEPESLVKLWMTSARATISSANDARTMQPLPPRPPRNLKPPLRQQYPNATGMRLQSCHRL
jgi:hypothetical protein